MIHKSSKDRKKTKAKYTLKGTADRPRLKVFRSNKHIYVQAIDDLNRKTIVQSSSIEKNIVELTKGKTKVSQAEVVGMEMGKRLNKLKIEKAIFDRSYYKYHGRVAALAEGVRKSNINL